MKKTNLIGAILFAMLTPQLLPAQQQITLHDADGKAFDVLLRKALPVKVLIYISTLENHRKAGVGKSPNQSFLFI